MFNKSMSSTTTNDPALSTDIYSKILVLNDVCGKLLPPQDHAALYCNRSQTLMSQFKFSEALADAEKSVHVDSTFEKVRYDKKNKVSFCRAHHNNTVFYSVCGGLCGWVWSVGGWVWVWVWV